MKWDILGLNKYESSVYETLVKHGIQSAFQISKNSRVPYGRIYDVLEELIKKSFIIIVPGTPKRYSIADPKIIADIVAKRKTEFLEMEKELSKLKKIYESGPEEAVILATGKKAWYDMVRILPDPKKEDYIIRYTSEFFPEWVRRIKQRISAGIPHYSLTRYDDETREAVQKWVKFDKTMRKYDNKGVAVWIVDDKAILIGLIKSNATLLIKDKAFIELMKDLFKDAYKNAEEIKLK
jgi:sugar-specific transcriptional regulator TrmB